MKLILGAHLVLKVEWMSVYQTLNMGGIPYLSVFSVMRDVKHIGERVPLVSPYKKISRHAI